jgi:hypothetical protein
MGEKRRSQKSGVRSRKTEERSPKKKAGNQDSESRSEEHSAVVMEIGSWLLTSYFFLLTPVFCLLSSVFRRGWSRYTESKPLSQSLRMSGVCANFRHQHSAGQGNRKRQLRMTRSIE